MKINDANPKVQCFQMDFKSLKKSDGTTGTKIKGYASTPTVDRYKDVVEPEAFRETILKAYKKNPMILFQHDPMQPIGKATVLSIDSSGLYIEAEIHNDPVEEKIAQGILRTMSIGYIPLETEYRDKNGYVLNIQDPNDMSRIWNEDGVKRIIKRLDLVEVSIVTVPANPDALFTMEKSFTKFFDEEIKSLTPEKMEAPKNLLEDELETEEKRKKKEPKESVAEPPKEEPKVEAPAAEPVAEPAKVETPAEAPKAEEPAKEEAKPEPVKEEAPKVTEPTEPSKPEAEKPEAQPPASETPSGTDGEKPVDKATFGFAVKAIKKLSDEKASLVAEVATLKEKLMKTPMKDAYSIESGKFAAPASTETKTEKAEEPKETEKAGFKAAFIKSARR